MNLFHVGSKFVYDNDGSVLNVARTMHILSFITNVFVSLQAFLYLEILFYISYNIYYAQNTFHRIQLKINSQ